MKCFYSPEGICCRSQENSEYCRSEQMLLRAAATGKILQGDVTLCDGGMNLHVDLGSDIRGFIPRGEALYSPTDGEIKDIAVITRVGKTVCFKVTGIAEQNGRKTALLSRRAAQRECFCCYVASLRPGDIIPARITHTESFGAFADIGCGIIALLPIDCISVSRISHPDERFTAGETIRCVVSSKEEESGRVYLSTRELFGTWEENASRFCAGQTVTGIVRSVEDYGIFIELAPNLAGLAEYRAGVEPGMTAAVYIKSMNPEKMKIKLVVIALSDTAPAAERVSFMNEGTEHISSWVYSPPGCAKRIESIFDE